MEDKEANEKKIVNNGKVERNQDVICLTISWTVAVFNVIPSILLLTQTVAFVLTCTTLNIGCKIIQFYAKNLNNLMKANKADRFKWLLLVLLGMTRHGLTLFVQIVNKTLRKSIVNGTTSCLSNLKSKCLL